MKNYLLLIAPLLLITVVVITLNVFFQQSLQIEVAENFNELQLILTEVLAANIKDHLQYMKRETIAIAYIVSKVKIDNEKDYQWLKNYLLSIKEFDKADVGILNGKGEIIFYSGDQDTLKKVYKEILKKAKSTPIGSSAIIETLNNIYFVAHSNELSHVTFLSISPADLVKVYLNNIQFNNKCNVWILTENGTLLFHPKQPEMFGKNIYTTEKKCFECHKNFDFEKMIIEGKENIKGKAIAPLGEERIIAYSKASLDNISWSVFMSAKLIDIFNITHRSMTLYSYLILSILMATIFIAIILFIYNARWIVAKEMEIKQENMERYTKDLEERVTEKTSAIAREREKLTTLLNAIGGGIILIDKKGKILWTNEMIKGIFNMEVVGKYCEELWTDCDISSTYAKDNIETVIMSFKNEKYLQMITAPVRNENGEIYQYIRLIQDITEIKKMEEQITNAEKLASIGRLAAGIAHEIGNPLTSIFSYVQILKETDDEKFRKESLDTIYYHIKRISEILKQLSGFSKMPSGELQKSNINEVIESSVRLVQYDKQTERIIFVKELSESLPEIEVDTNQLLQVFINLTLNAIDAMPEGGRLTIRSYAQGNNIVIDFEDTGIGIPRENLSKIFDPFYTTKEKGTGLGLAVSYNIIKKMNGDISVNSEFAKGTVFKITLPIDKNKG